MIVLSMRCEGLHYTKKARELKRDVAPGMRDEIRVVLARD